MSIELAKGLRVAVVAYSWPPSNSIGTHRPYSMAKYWSKLGCEVHVLTAKKYAFDEPLDLNLPSLDSVTVTTVPYLRSGVINRLLSSSVLRNLAKRLKAWLTRRSGKEVDVRALWATAAIPIARKLAKDVDVVFSTYSPAASFEIACEMKKENPALFWVADYRDPWSENEARIVSEEVRSKERAHEKALLMPADLIVSVSPGFSAVLAELHGREVKVFENGFDPDNLLDVEEVVSFSCSFPFVYVGNIYSNQVSPLPLIEAIEELAESEEIERGLVELHVFGPASTLGALGDAANSHAVRYRGHVPYRVALAAQKSASCLLHLQSDGAAKTGKGVIAAKIFEYMFSGTPVLSLGRNMDFDAASLLKRSGVGCVVKPCKEELKKVIREIVAGNKPSWYKPNSDVISSMTRERVAQRLMSEIISLRETSGGR